jgi:hypothetical protein
MLIILSDVQAWARSPKPAQAGPRKPSQAQAVLMALGGLRLRLQICKAQALGLSRGLNCHVVGITWVYALELRDKLYTG